MEVQRVCYDSIDQVIKTGGYRSEDFNSDASNIFLIVHWLRDQPITADMMAEVAELLKFYGMPFLFQLKVVYDRMDDKVKKSCQRQLQTIMLIAKDYLDGEKIEELSFVYDVEGIKAKINFIPRQKTQRELKFINYWRRLRNSYLSIKNMPSQKFQAKQQAINNFFQKELIDTPDFNTFEIRVADTYADKVREVYSDMLTEKSPNMNTTVSRTPISKEDSSDEQFPKPKRKNEESKQTKPLREDDLRNRKEEQLPMCCRRFFYKDEVLVHAQSSILQFKNYRYPWNPQLQNTLLKAICGFLNMKGGIILIGVAEHTDTKKPVVTGHSIYDENTKQQVHFKITAMARKIYPDIVTNNKYMVQFVPVKSRETNNFIAGAYVIRVIIEYGDRDSIYYFNDGAEDLYMFRQQKQVIRKKTSQALDIFKRRVKEPAAVPPKIHEGTCLMPDHGKPIYGNPMDSDKREKEQRRKRYQEEQTKQRKQYKEKDSGPKTNPQQMPQMRQMPPPQIPTPKVDYNSRIRVIMNIPYFSSQVREIIEKIAGNAKVTARAYKDLPDMAIMEFDKKYLQLINNNLTDVKKQYEQCRDLLAIEPTASLIFRGKMGEEHTKKASQILGQRNICLFQSDFGEQVIRFKSVPDCINCFFIIKSSGLNPRFSNK